MSDALSKIREAVIDGQQKRTMQLVQTALAGGAPAGVILNQALLPAMEEVGRQFENHECYIPEMMLSARAMRDAVDYLKPHLKTGDTKRIGKALIGTVSGDLHDIGKNLVIIMTEGAGFEVKDLSLIHI